MILHMNSIFKKIYPQHRQDILVRIEMFRLKIFYFDLYLTSMRSKSEHQLDGNHM